MMKPIRAIFLDDGGVLSDNTKRGREWERLLGEFLSPRLGGEPALWEKANRTVFGEQMRRYESWVKQQAAGEFADFFGLREERLSWLGGMCARVGIATLPDDECHSLALETEAFVLPRVRAAIDGAAETVHALAAAGYQLHTASGGSSRELEGYLTGMGVRERFGERLYGPDIVQILKHRVEYYEAIFADAGVDPTESLVVDDNAGQVELARVAGARAVLVSQGARNGDSIAALRELPKLLDSMR